MLVNLTLDAPKRLPSYDEDNLANRHIRAETVNAVLISHFRFDELLGVKCIAHISLIMMLVLFRDHCS